MASIFNFPLDAGADNSVEITYAPNGVAFSLTGWTIRAQFRGKRNAWHTFELTSAAGTIAINAAVLTLNFASALSSTLNGVYVYDVTATNGTAVRRIVEGVVTVSPAVTR